MTLAMADARKIAGVIYRRALREGQISRPSNCERCYAGGLIVGHHDNYSKPLEVMWLCKKCHGKRHRELGWGMGNYGGRGRPPLRNETPNRITIHDAETPLASQILIDRRDAKLTQEEVAKAVPDLKRVTLQDIEHGRVVPSEELGKSILQAIAGLRKGN